MSHQLKTQKVGDQIIVELSGTIDEETTFPPEILQGATSIVFDFQNVMSINSCGIREWIKWLMPSNSVPVWYRHCPKVIVDQINMVDGFLPVKGLVESFYVPYYSEDTGEEKHILFKYGAEFDDHGVHFPQSIVDSKNQPMEIDVIESKYFRFLQKQSKAA